VKPARALPASGPSLPGGPPSLSCSGCGRVGRFLATEAGGPCAPDAARSAVHCAGLHAAAQTGLHRSSLPRGASACRQDTRAGGVRPSARANTPGPGGCGHTATAKGPAVYARGGVDGPERPPDAAPCRPDRGGPARGARCRGSRGWVRGPIPSPSSAMTGPGPVPDSGSHVLQCSGVYSRSFAWQHHSPSGPAVSHLELELKGPFLTWPEHPAVAPGTGLLQWR
jgi:hypothetical protein